MERKRSIKEITFIAMGAALMAVLSQISIPLPIGVPITLQAFWVVILGVVLERKLVMGVMGIYMLLGAIGVPVFANFKAGLNVIVGPTGGYLIGFVIMAVLVGWASSSNHIGKIIGMAYIGLFLDYVIGVGQLMFVSKLSLTQGLVGGFYPFVVKDVLLVGIGVIVALKMKKLLRRVILKPVV